ncbi:MAG: alanine--tRNA ligase-related protein, partial [Candidatus Berkelbacteria bacterium]|nr:alanine--tRNA ligase-related protein [Candidatus Berkelbacteria bacterium]
MANILMKSNELREKFLEFFEKRGHKVIPSSSLVPENDPSVLFTTAGMQQFKRYYTNPSDAPAPKIVTCQKCIRTGDIEEVGDDTHLTFFEMLGNFSFGYPEKEGSYFKEKAIKLGWEFLTEELKIEKKRIHSTYFEGKTEIPADEESLKILQEIEGLEEIKPQGFDDNFWSLGTEGSPGGPTVEYYIDGIEVWNLVFNEFNFINGKYEPSQHKGVDTGMGLERLLTVINGKKDVYETDLFEPIISKVYDELPLDPSRDVEYARIVADNLKASVMIANEGILPGKNREEYVLRRLIRNAIDHCDLKEYPEWIKPVIESAIDVYCEAEDFASLLANKGKIFEVVFEEAKKYSEILVSAEKLLNKKENFSEKDAAYLHQTLGIPFGLYNDYSIMKQTKKLSYEKFLEYEQKHQALSRTASAGMFKGGLADSGEQAIKYHTATHLLQQALREVLGDHVAQKGSNINVERMRFDFTHPDKMTPEQIKKVENIINEKIEADLPVTMAEMSPEEAKKSGAIGLFEH